MGHFIIQCKDNLFLKVYRVHALLMSISENSILNTFRQIRPVIVNQSRALRELRHCGQATTMTALNMTARPVA